MPISLEATPKGTILKIKVLESEDPGRDRDRLLKIPNRKPVYIKGLLSHWETGAEQLGTIMGLFEDHELSLNEKAKTMIKSFQIANLMLEDLPRYEGKLFQSLDGKVPRPHQEKVIRIDFKKKPILLAFQMGLGKQQPISEPVLTPDGWSTMGQLKPGDLVIGSQGTPIKVLEVFPQTERKTYMVTFVDGTATRCGPDHLWTTYRARSPEKMEVFSTKYLIEDGLRDNHGKGNLKFRIPMIEPIEFQKKDLPVDPYLLGVILGDGSITKSGGSVVTSDLEICEKVGGTNIRPHPTSEKVVYFSIVGETSGRMKALGLALKRSQEKFIPPVYLLGSIEQRKSLLAGLIDTDGNAMSEGGIEFSSTSEDLMDGVIELTRSLGGIARNKTARQTYYTDKNGDKKAGLPSWRVNLKTNFNPFKLSRKAEAWVEPTKYPCVKIISSIEEVEPEDSVCISIDAEDHLYATKDYILTHNTYAALIRMATINPEFKTLIILPKRLRDKWQSDVWNTLGKESVIYHGNVKQRKKLLEQLPGAQFVIATYETLKEITPLNLKFEFIIIDEIHIPGGGSAIYKHLNTMLRNNEESYKLGLSGTPMRLTLENLYDVCRLLDPAWAGSKTGFLNKFQKTLVRKKITKRNRFGQIYSFYVPIKVATQNPELLREKLGSIMCRATREGLIDFADLSEPIPVPMTAKQTTLYQQVLEQVREDVKSGKGNPMTEILRCLQMSEGSYTLFPDTLESGKLDYLLEELKNREGEKACIWYRYLPGTRILHEKLKDTSVLINGEMNDSMKKYAKWALNGCTNSREEEEFFLIKEKYGLKFNPGEALYLISTYSLKSGMGDDYDKAALNYFMSYDYSPTSLAQARDRIIRLNQTRDCFSNFIVSTGTIERRALGNILKKLENTQSVIDGSWSTSVSQTKEIYDLLFEKGSR